MLAGSLLAVASPPPFLGGRWAVRAQACPSDTLKERRTKDKPGHKFYLQEPVRCLVGSSCCLPASASGRC